MSRLRNSSSFTLTVVKRKKTFQNELFIALIFAVQNSYLFKDKLADFDDRHSTLSLATFGELTDRNRDVELIDAHLSGVRVGRLGGVLNLHGPKHVLLRRGGQQGQHLSHLELVIVVLALEDV